MNFSLRMNGSSKIPLKGKGIFTFRNFETGEILRSTRYRNTIVDVCNNMIAARLVGGAGSCDITYGAVGTGAFPGNPANSTTLVTELARVALSYISATTNVISLTAFFGASEGNGVLTEWGAFGQGASATPNSGVMILHSQISETKTSSETLTISWLITVG